MHFEVRAFSPNKGVQVLYWEVADEAEAKARASQEGLEVIGLRQSTSTAHRTGNWKPWRAKHFSTHQFGQELLALLEAGFGLVEAIETLHSKENNEHDRSVVSGILRLLRGGAAFSKALAAFPEQFPPLFLESIRASERTGDVPRTLRRYLAYGLILRNVDQSGYPPTLKILVDGVPNAKSPGRQLLYFLRRVPRDPFADPSLPAESTWGLRSYASPADSPVAGADVYDVHSLSDLEGLNGIPYLRPGRTHPGGS